MKKLEKMAEIVFSDAWQYKMIKSVFGLIGILCLVSAVWQPGALIGVIICAAMIAAAKPNK